MGSEVDFLKLYHRFTALELRDFLISEFGFVDLESSTLSVNGAYLIHPANWPKSDIENAKKCWPAMERVGLQFVGVNAPESINGYTPKHFDGYLDGLACELKFIEPKSEILSQEKLVANIKDHLLKANKQGAEIAVIIISKTTNTNSINWEIMEARIEGTIKKQYKTLKKAILLPENGKSII